MLSRAADAIYWMNRYVERGENIARLLDVSFQLMLDSPRDMEPWEPLVTTTGDRDIFLERFKVATKVNVLAFLMFDAENPNSILSCLSAARENARSVREIISSEMWEEINKFYLMVRTAASSGQPIETPHDFLIAVRTANHLYLGITDSTMSYGEAWHFGRLGRLLERADKTSRLLSTEYSMLPSLNGETRESNEEVRWSAVLKSASAFQMYRQRYGRIKHSLVANFLISDRQFPRAIHACVLGAGASLQSLTSSKEDSVQSPAEERLYHLQRELSDLEAQDYRENVPHLLNTIQAKLNGVDDAIFETFLTNHPIG